MGHHSQENPDRDLVLAFQDGDRRAYEEIYRRYHERVHHTCMRILHNPADAAEATQETFLRGFRGLQSFNGRYQLGAWLTRIASNVSVDALRARSRSVNVVTITDEVARLPENVTRSDTTVEEKVAVGEALDEMQPLHAQALFLRAVEGLSHNEMASRLEMSPAQVKSLLHRSRSSFKRVWEQASGWALAPLGWLRVTRKDDGLAAASPASSVMMERVATSAVAAVIAVAGFSAATDPDLSAPPPRVQVPVPVPDVPAGDDPRLAQVAVNEAQAPSATENGEPAGRLEAVAAIKGAVAAQITEEEPEDSNGGGGLPAGTPFGKRPLPDPAKEAVEKVGSALSQDHEGGQTR
jgi:RNA polymerase sigma-70 factor (ECF subfamily)